MEDSSGQPVGDPQPLDAVEYDKEEVPVSAEEAGAAPAPAQKKVQELDDEVYAAGTSVRQWRCHNCGMIFKGERGKEALGDSETLLSVVSELHDCLQRTTSNHSARETDSATWRRFASWC